MIMFYRTCKNRPFGRYSLHMSIAAEKVAEALALPERDRAFLAGNSSPALTTPWMLTPKTSGTKSLTGAPAKWQKVGWMSVRKKR